MGPTINVISKSLNWIEIPVIIEESELLFIKKKNIGIFHYF